MNLTDCARGHGIHPQTTHRWFRGGTRPVPAVRVNQRMGLLSAAAPAPEPVSHSGLYARVSSHDQQAGLGRQVARLTAWAADAGGQVVRVEAGAGSGMNGSRTKARRLLAGPRVSAVVAGHRGRLGRVNTELAESALAAHGRRLVVPDDGEAGDGLVRDMVEVLTWFCARLYGRRSARNPGVEGGRVRSVTLARRRLSALTGRVPARRAGSRVVMAKVGELKRAAQELGAASTTLRQQGWKTASPERVQAVNDKRARIEREQDAAHQAGVSRAGQLARRAFGGQHG